MRLGSGTGHDCTVAIKLVVKMQIRKFRTVSGKVIGTAFSIYAVGQVQLA